MSAHNAAAGYRLRCEQLDDREAPVRIFEGGAR